MFEIRQAKQADIPDLVVLDDECFDTYYYKKTKFNRSNFQAYLRGRKSIFLVAVRDSHLVGYVAGTARASPAPSIAYLDSIAVSPIARRLGLGSDLLQHFVQEAKQQACKMALLEVAEANKEGFRFFSKRGFRQIRDLPGHYGRGLDGVLMGLRV